MIGGGNATEREKSMRAWGAWQALNFHGEGKVHEVWNEKGKGNGSGNGKGKGNGDGKDVDGG
eukprot:108721-Chlamydomonas_euryale.AAC.1